MLLGMPVSVIAMDARMKVFTTIGMMLLSAHGIANPAQGTTQHCTSEECACEEALRRNTVEALEDFLRRYPQATNNSGSACAALAMPTFDDVSEPRKRDNPDSE